MEILKGKQAIFKCVLHAIKTIELPNEDDEFAKDVSQFKSLKELREDVRSKLEAKRFRESNEIVEAQIYSKLVEEVKVSLPNVMINRKIDSLVSDFERGLKQRGMNLESYLDRIGVNLEDFRRSFLSRAVNEIRMDMALKKVAELEKIEVSESELENGFEVFARNCGATVEMVKRIVSSRVLKDDILLGKALDFIKNSVKIVESDEESLSSDDDGEELEEQSGSKSTASKTKKTSKEDKDDGKETKSAASKTKKTYKEIGE